MFRTSVVIGKHSRGERVTLESGAPRVVPGSVTEKASTGGCVVETAWRASGSHGLLNG